MKAGKVSDLADATQCDCTRAPREPLLRAFVCETRLVVTVNLTRIYTMLGDGGETHLGDMSRVSKLHPRVEAYGTVDELGATIGVALAQQGLPASFAQWLARVQNDLLDVGADLSVPAPPDGEPDATGKGQARLRVTPEYAGWLERVCDEVNAKLEPLRSFVIPGGTPAAAQLHVCRTVCRRAERRAIAVGEECNPEVIRYLNRLSDMLFILSRAANESGARGKSEPLWAPGAHGAERADSDA
jgi:cob(I)alamin adenosyltransferase